MSSVSINEKHLTMQDHNGKEIELVSFRDYSFFRDEKLHNILLNLCKKSRDILSYSSDAEAIAHFVTDGLLASHLLESLKPVKLIELGCTNGKLSFHLAQLLGKFDSDSLLCLVDEELSNDNRVACLDTIAAAECSPEISMIFSDYNRTHLADNYFDYVFINGTVNFNDPAAVILEAERLVKPGGVIFSICDNSHLLASTFKLIFPEYNEYMVTPQEIVLKTTCCQSSIFRQRM